MNIPVKDCHTANFDPAQCRLAIEIIGGGADDRGLALSGLLPTQPSHHTSVLSRRSSGPIRHPASAQAAIASRILLQILLVIVLGVVELRRVLDLRRDRTVTGT